MGEGWAILSRPALTHTLRITAILRESASALRILSATQTVWRKGRGFAPPGTALDRTTV
jgi:hypothetical protein